MINKYKLQALNIPKEWEIKRNVFFDIDANDNIPEEHKFSNIYCQEDMLWMVNDDYNLDLGWYGSDDLENASTGFMLVLYKGKGWNNCELLELTRTKSKKAIIKKIDEILEAFAKGFFDDKVGYKISEDQTNYRYIGQHLQYSIKNNLNELII